MSNHFLHLKYDEVVIYAEAGQMLIQAGTDGMALVKTLVDQHNKFTHRVHQKEVRQRPGDVMYVTKTLRLWVSPEGQQTPIVVALVQVRSKRGKNFDSAIIVLESNMPPEMVIDIDPTTMFGFGRFDVQTQPADAVAPIQVNPTVLDMAGGRRSALGQELQTQSERAAKKDPIELVVNVNAQGDKVSAGGILLA